ncbi:MAG: phytanoyl-CoA dioxygenase family protein [Pyrinomonadaceae bacterium]
MFESGFCIEPNVFTADECQRIFSSIRSTEDFRSRAGVRNLMANQEVAAIAKDQRLLGITKQISGKSLTPFKATLFEKTGKANWLVAWHQDTALPLEKPIHADGWGPSSVKAGVAFVHSPTWALRQILALRIQLDSSTPENGPLKVIPGSHKKRLLTDLEFDRVVFDGPRVDCVAERGSVIAMRPLIVHASSKSLSHKPRRVLHIEYAESLDLGNGIRLAIA